MQLHSGGNLSIIKAGNKNTNTAFAKDNDDDSNN
jgi:hypothetical protein